MTRTDPDPDESGINLSRRQKQAAGVFEWKNSSCYPAVLILYFRGRNPYDIHVPDDRYTRNDETEEKTMLRLLGILSLGDMVFGRRRCCCRHHYRHRGLPGRGLLLGTLLGLFFEPCE